MGADLKAFIEEKCSVKCVTRFVKANGGVGKFYDEQDLKDKYKNKPEDFLAIKENGYSFVCPIKNKRFYEDIDYVSSSTNTSEVERKRELEVSVESSKKKAKTVKKQEDDTDAVADDSTNKPKPMGDKQITQTRKILEIVCENQDILNTYVEICEHDEIKDMIPKYIVPKAKLRVAELAVFESTCSLAIDEKKADGFKEHQQSAKDFRTKALDLQKKVAAQFEAAVAEIGKEVVWNDDGAWAISAPAAK